MSAEKTQECPSCALEAPAEAEVCPYCGYEFPQQKGGLPVIAALFLVLMLIWFVGC